MRWGRCGRWGRGLMPFALGLLLAGLGGLIAATAGQPGVGPTLPVVVGERDEFQGRSGGAGGASWAGCWRSWCWGPMGGWCRRRSLACSSRRWGTGGGSVREALGLALGVTLVGVGAVLLRAAGAVAVVALGCRLTLWRRA